MRDGNPQTETVIRVGDLVEVVNNHLPKCLGLRVGTVIQVLKPGVYGWPEYLVKFRRQECLNGGKRAEKKKKRGYEKKVVVRHGIFFGIQLVKCPALAA